jgi:iron uptake system component EfeO
LNPTSNGSVRVIIGSAALCILLAIPAAAARSAPLDEATEGYRRLMIADMDQALAGAQALRERLDADDVPGAKKAWIAARVGWERSEVFTAGFIPDLDDAIDAWPDATAGFHGIEARLFGGNRTDVGDQMAMLIVHLTEADQRVRTMPLTAQGLLNGVARLAYEVGDSKVDGGESRFSGTSLDDMRNNAEGIDLAYRSLFAPTLEARDGNLATQVGNKIAELKELLGAKDLKSIDPQRLQKASEALVVALQAAGPKLGLATPTLEDTAR